MVNPDRVTLSLRWALRLLLASPSRFEEAPVHQSKGDIIRSGNSPEFYTIFVFILFGTVRRLHLWNVRQRV